MNQLLFQKTKYLILLVGFFFAPSFAFASVAISEIMYDPPGADTSHEWIEINNDSDTAVDLSGWKLFENNSNHSLTLISSSATLPAHGFAIIAENATTFQSDWPAFLDSSAILFDSVFSLSNTGETIAIKDSTGAIVDEATYNSASGAAGDGNTLNGSETVWVSATATPGKIKSENHTTAENENNGSGNSEGESASNSNSENENTNSENLVTKQDDTKASKAQKKITAKIILPSSASYFDASIHISASIIGISGKPIDHGYIMWNFGDGEMYTSVNTDPAVHVYAYPGRYVVQTSYFEHYYDTQPIAIDRATISIVAPKIEFTDDGLTLSIKNASKTESDISNWRIRPGASDSVKTISATEAGVPENDFIFPANTFLLAGSTIILDKKKIGLSQNADVYSLLYPNMLVVTTTNETPIVPLQTIVQIAEIEKTEVVEKEKDQSETFTPVDIQPETSTVESVDTPIIPEVLPTQKPKTKSKIPIKVLLLFAGIVSVGVFGSLLFSGTPTSKELEEKESEDI